MLQPDGKAVVFYPEGTLTRDPELWPMVGRTGAARVALESGAPLVPVAQWGVHEILFPYSKRIHLVPPRIVHIKVGDPVEIIGLKKDNTPTTIAHGIRATITPTAQANVIAGHVAGWIGVAAVVAVVALYLVWRSRRIARDA